MIVFSDLHLKESTEDVCFRVLDAVAELAAADDGRVVFCGDFWQLRYQVSVRLLNRVVDWLALHTGLRLDMLPGNHDQVTSDGRNALEVLGALPNVYVWTCTGFVKWDRKWLAMVPYRKDPAEQREELEQGFAGGVVPAAYVFAHCGVHGALMNTAGRKDQGGLVLDVAHKAPLILGHYHRPQEVMPGVTYVGSPYQQSFGEAGNEPRVLRITDKGVESIPLDVGAPRHFIVSWDGRGRAPEKPEGFREGDKLRVDLHAEVSQLADKKVVKKLHKELDGAVINVIPVTADRERRFEVPAGESLQGAAERFVRERFKTVDELVHLDEGQIDRVTAALKRWAGEV